jgi:flagellar FliJ protein
MSARGLASLIRLQRWRIDQKRRELAELEQQRADCAQRIEALSARIKAEQSGSDDAVLTFSYANYVRAALAQRQSLSDTLAKMDDAVAACRADIAAVFRDLKKFEVAQARREEQAAQEQTRREQSDMDEVAMNLFRRSV